MTHHPTRQTYDELQRAFDFFNETLFEGRLPACLITLQRQHDTYGYFSRDRFVSRDGSGQRTHEIALNPSYFAIRSIPETLSVLAREMVSLDQTLNGTPGRRRYHNKEWGDMLEAIGLMPSDTGLPGGKRTGEKVEHYIIADGPFDLACRKLVDDEFTLSWVDRFPPMPDAAIAGLGDDGGAEPESSSPSGTALVFPESMGVESDPVIRPAFSFVEGEGGADGGAIEDELAGGLMSAIGGAADNILGQVDGLVAGLLGADGEDEDAGEPEESAAAAVMRRFEPVRRESLEQLGVEVQERKTTAGSRVKYRCPGCGIQTWGKPGLLLGCYHCESKPALMPA